jgi:hypothetical protein
MEHQTELLGEPINNLFLEGGLHYTQPFLKARFNLTPTNNGGVIVRKDNICGRDRVEIKRSENGMLSKEEFMSNYPERNSLFFTLNNVYPGELEIVLRKTPGKDTYGNSKLGKNYFGGEGRGNLNGELEGIYSDLKIRDLDDLATCLAEMSKIEFSAPKDAMLTVNDFIESGGCCRHFAPLLSLILEKNSVVNALVAGIGYNTSEKGIRYFQLSDVGHPSPHEWTEAIIHGSRYWIDPTIWSPWRKAGLLEKNFQEILRRSVRKLGSPTNGISTPNLYEETCMPNESIYDTGKTGPLKSVELLETRF